MPELKQELLGEILGTFADDGKVFSNEAQFQFELARALAKKNYIITFEHLTYFKDDNGNREKMYTDLIVEDKEGELYAIELKYKTPDKEYIYTTYNDKSAKNTYYTFGQGAEDSGCYDYLKDVERLERLIFGDFKSKFKYPNGKKIIRGFAIILTNSSKYYEHPRDNYNYYWENFFLKKDGEIEKEQSLYWCDKAGRNIKINTENDTEKWVYVDSNEEKEADYYPKCGKERNSEITLKNSYKFEWKPYEVKFEKDKSNQPEFQYLILTVKEQ